MNNCKICGDSNTGPEHEMSEKHLKNKVLADYAMKRKQLYGNRKGVAVSCNVKSLVDYTDAKIKVSVKPNEEVTFKFTVLNESKKEDIAVIFIQAAHSQLNFTMSEHGLPYGGKLVTLKPKSSLQREVSVTFKCADIGQYELPVIFSFRKVATGEGVLIIRDLVVFVEEQQRVHEKKISPYAQKEVKAKKLYNTTLVDKSDDMFRIPKNYKPIYASGLKLKDDALQSQKDFCKDICEIFKTGVTPDNYVPFFHNLLWFEETIVRINLKNYNMSNVPLLPQGDSFALVVPGLSEKRPSLMLGDLLFVKPHDNEDVMFEAVITDMSDNVVSIKGLHPEFSKHFQYRARFDVRFFMSRLSLERMHCAVQACVPGHPDQRRVFPIEGKTPPGGSPQPIEKFFNPLVRDNPEQHSAVEHIVAGTAGGAPYLLHGPPGTGKTVTIVEAILQIVSRSDSTRVLVCTDSNMAADHVASVLVKYKEHFPPEHWLLRANSKFRVWETLPQCLHEYSNGSTKEQFYSVHIEDFCKYRILVTTLSHAAKFAKDLKKYRMQRPITHLFIDEAAQASEPACLIPVTGLLAAQGALTLAGDPMQLGPVVISKRADKLGLGLSLMERLKTTCPLYGSSDPHYTLMLRNNFRSDPAILTIPNRLFYNDQLRALAAADPLSGADVWGERPTSAAVVFHAVLSKEQRMGKSPSYYNEMELEIVQRYIKRLVTRHRVQPEDIGVVTPYIRQVSKVRTWLDTTKWGGKIEVGTVEAFQGKEKRVIIISTVRAQCNLLEQDARFHLGFLVDDKRFNVAITRAKAKVIIIGNPLCLSRDAKWRQYLEQCASLGTYTGYVAPSAPQHKHIADTLTPILNTLKIDNKG